MKIKKYKMSDLYDISSGISTEKNQAGHGSPFISFRTVFNNYFLPGKIEDLMDTTLEEQKKYSIKEGDILITRTSETIDELAMSSVALKDYNNVTYSGFLKRLRPKKGTNKIVYHKYIAFYLRSYLFRKTMENNALMTLRASFNEDMFSFLEIYLPEFSNQVKIGNMLYDMEKKIRLNTEINNNLEQYAKLLYDYWFNQFDFPDINGKPYRSSGGEISKDIPYNWYKVSINEIADLYQPKTISNNDFVSNGKYLVFGANGIIGRYNKYNHESNEIAVTCRGANCGNIIMTQPYSWITGNAMVVKPKNNFAYKEYLYYYLTPEIIYPLVSGSAQPQLTRSNLQNLQVLIPPIELLEAFEKISSKIRSEIQNNFKENQELSQLRNFLLPLLINGQATLK